MAKNNRAYKSAKRNKEISRLKKAEEKRRRKVEREKSGISGPPIEGIDDGPADEAAGDAEAPETIDATPESQKPAAG